MMTTSEFMITVPGVFRNGSAYLDLETEKVPAEGRTGRVFVMKNGEVLRRRWSILLYGVALNGEIHLSDNDTEAENITGLDNILHGVDEAVYAATREFDEMVARGRFTNARRAHEPEPFFPFSVSASSIPWRNLHHIPLDITRCRETDINSARVPDLYRAGQKELVYVHLLRDVVQLILADANFRNNYPDDECTDWCMNVMMNYRFAWGQVFGDEEA